MSPIIVTGVDGSETAARAAHRAAELARDLHAELHVLTAYGVRESKVFNDGVEKVVSADIDKAERVAAETARELSRSFPGLTIISFAAEGSPAVALVNAAKRLNAAFIVVGNKRVQGASRILGSVARSVASHAPCDLYIAHTTGSVSSEAR